MKHFHLEFAIMSQDKPLRKVGTLFAAVLLAKVTNLEESAIVSSSDAHDRIRNEMVKFCMQTQMKLKQRVDAQDSLLADVLPEIETLIKNSSSKGLGIKSQFRSDYMEDLYAKTGSKTREDMEQGR